GVDVEPAIEVVAPLGLVVESDRHLAVPEPAEAVGQAGAEGRAPAVVVQVAELAPPHRASNPVGGVALEVVAAIVGQLAAVGLLSSRARAGELPVQVGAEQTGELVL